MDNKVQDNEIIKEDDNIKKVVSNALQKFMGRALDLARISEMSDRSFNQFQKSLKDECYNLIDQIGILISKK
jgi:predicted HTH domain antitoxin